MKNLIITIALSIAALSASAQKLISTPSDLNMDSTEFAKLYGTVKEYNFQIVQIDEKKPILFINTKTKYMREFCVYLANNGYSGSVDYDGGHDWIEYSVYRAVGWVEDVKTPIKIKAIFNANTLRTKSVTITGNPDDVIKLFVYYWPSEISLNKLKQGGYVYQDYISDRVAFSWKGKQPVITVTASPNIDFTKVFQ